MEKGSTNLESGELYRVLVDTSPDAVTQTSRDVSHDVEAVQIRNRHTLGLEIIHQIDCAILAACSPTEIAEAALQQLRRWIAPELRTNVMTFDWRAGIAHVLAVDVPGEPHWPAGSRVPLEEIGSLETLWQGNAIVADDLAAVSQMNVRAELIDGLDIHGCILMPMLLRDELVGLISLVSSSAHKFDDGDVKVVQQVAGALAVAIHEARLCGELDRAHANVRGLSGRLLQAQEMERQRIARELHDQIGQVLTAVKLNIQAVQRLPGIDGQKSRVQECVHMIDDAIALVRDLSLDLRPSLLDDLGLVATLRWYVDREAQRGGLDAKFLAQPGEMTLAPDVEIVAFRIAQEAIANVLRHAQAEHLSVQIRQENDALHLAVCDDGIGFEPSSIATSSAPHEGLGLLGMYERAQLAGGRVQLDSAPGRGTSVCACLPLHSQVTQMDYVPSNWGKERPGR